MVRPLFIVALFLLVPPYAIAERPRISAAKLIDWLDKADPPLVLDVRGREIYRAGSLPGAINAGSDPLGYLPGGSKDPVVLIVPDETDVKFIDAWRRRLADAGHKVWILEQGLSGWKGVGGVVETSDAAYAKPGRVPFIIPRGLCEGNDPAQTFE